ncbi:hydroxymethylbilane synthase [Desertimonas flava]|uniref:hydroxymethylbilane synthase n=1 Tax=Desertimonas flava TaxID=2064846 RepID=UPI000E34F6CF|nr:hydroxymethylbilane synthase [Desertimonas flava]
MSGAPLRLATRGSPQASTQAAAVADAITAATGRPVELVIVETTGDRRSTVPLHTIGGQGVFTKEIQLAVLEGRADAAVHSAKDLPTTTPDALTVGAFCARRDPSDALIGNRFDELPAGATVATGSVRRRAQLASARPDLGFVELRGNIARRLEQIPDGGAIVMAVAALEVLGMTDRIAERLPIDRFVPAVGQGCVAVECRADDDAALAALGVVDDVTTRHAVEVERAYLAELGSGCSLPVAAHVTDVGLHVFLAATDIITPGETPVVFRETLTMSGVVDDDLELARTAADRARQAVGWSG